MLPHQHRNSKWRRPTPPLCVWVGIFHNSLSSRFDRHTPLATKLLSDFGWGVIPFRRLFSCCVERDAKSSFLRQSCLLTSHIGHESFFVVSWLMNFRLSEGVIHNISMTHPNSGLKTNPQPLHSPKRGSHESETFFSSFWLERAVTNKGGSVMNYGVLR